jgi:2-succinyl-5-enolpyruvyl-6-hydroxy-3-cyclohexene-1-carboxylate synthase
MASATDTHLLLRAFVDELARCGMRDACTSPGSRNAPLILALAREERLRSFSHIDERAAGFFALGLAKASGLPVAVTCTSGTAAAELLPAAIEAREARVPLLLLTADRPAELRDVGAGQAIDQLKLYGGAVKWFVEVAPGGASPAQLRWIRTLACRAYWTALEGRPGAVHLNFPLREPLIGTEAPPPDDSGRPGGAPFVRRGWGQAASTPDSFVPFMDAIEGAQRGVLVAGRHERGTPLGKAASTFAEAAGWPLLADPMSGARRGDAAIARYDALLRVDRLAEELTPDLVLRVGDLPVSKPLRGWLAGLREVRQIALDPEGAWQDPDAAVSLSLPLDPAETLSALGEFVGMDEGPQAAAPEWLAAWRAADESAAAAIQGVVATAGLSEPGVAAELGALLPAEATLFVASSMPVRDIETFWPARTDPPRVLCNRGANGIDGTISSAFGAAAANGARPTVLLIGDVALAHDIGGLLAARRLGLKLTIVALENGGGGIFDFLEVARSPLATAHYEAHVATPAGLDLAAVASLYGLGHERPQDLRSFRTAIESALAGTGSTIVEVRTERSANVELHRRVWDAVARG